MARTMQLWGLLIPTLVQRQRSAGAATNTNRNHPAVLRAPLERNVRPWCQLSLRCGTHFVRKSELDEIRIFIRAQMNFSPSLHSKPSYPNHPATPLWPLLLLGVQKRRCVGYLLGCEDTARLSVIVYPAVHTGFGYRSTSFGEAIANNFA